jgi:hypothetical protein
LPADIYNDRNDTRIRVRDIFGIRGSAPAGIESETTVRGKILNRGLDTDRIGGGITEYIEQFADDIYNWCVQLMYVYSREYQFLPDAKPPKVRISVKEGSLLPKDTTTIANQSIELASAGRMSIVDMYKRLEYPNPEELAANVWLEANAPQLLFQDNELVQQALQMQSQSTQEQNSAVNDEKIKDAEIEIAKEEGKQAAQAQFNIAEARGEEIASSLPPII